jgi:RND family efflux transporter MFP subunit
MRAFFISVRAIALCCWAVSVCAACTDSTAHTVTPHTANGAVESVQNGGAPQVRIVTEKIRSQTMTQRINCVGQVHPEIGKTSLVSCRLPGKLKSLSVDLGDSVAVGQIVAWVDSKEIGELEAELIEGQTAMRTAQSHEEREALVYHEQLARPHKLTEATARYKQSKVAFELAQEDYERVEKLFNSKIAAGREFKAAKANLEKTRFEYEEATSLYTLETQLFQNKSLIRKDLDLARAETRRSREHLDTLKQKLVMLGVGSEEIKQLLAGKPLLGSVAVRSPIAGEVAQFFVTPGGTVDPDNPILEVSDISTVVINSEVPETDVVRISVGQKLTAKFSALGNEEFAGVVSHVGTRVNPDTRTVQVKSLIGNPQRRLKFNMFAEVSIDSAPYVAVVCPVSAIHHEANRATVFIEKDGAYQKRYVVLGQAQDKTVEIKHGLSMGETVVTDGSILVKTELTYGTHD